MQYLGFIEARAGLDFRAIPFPGTAEIFVYDAAGMALTRRAPFPAGAAAVLDLIGSVDGQTALSNAIGSVPARVDGDVSALDAVTRTVAEHYRTFGVHLVHGRFADGFEPMLEMYRTRDPAPVLTWLQSAYPDFGGVATSD
jgi:hypothetical protein